MTQSLKRWLLSIFVWLPCGALASPPAHAQSVLYPWNGEPVWHRLGAVTGMGDMNGDSAADFLLTTLPLEGGPRILLSISGADGSVLNAWTGSGVPFRALLGASLRRPGGSTFLVVPPSPGRVRYVVVRDNLAGTISMVGAYASAGSSTWGMVGNVVTASTGGTLGSYRFIGYGIQGGGEPTQSQWDDLDFEVNYWPSEAAFFNSPQAGTVQAFFSAPTNPDWYTTIVGNYNGLNQRSFEFNLASLGIPVGQGQTFVIAVQGLEDIVSARLYNSFSNTAPSGIGSDPYASHVYPTGDYFSNLGAPTNWVGSKVVVRIP